MILFKICSNYINELIDTAPLECLNCNFKNDELHCLRLRGLLLYVLLASSPLFNLRYIMLCVAILMDVGCWLHWSSVSQSWLMISIAIINAITPVSIQARLLIVASTSLHIDFRITVWMIKGWRWRSSRNSWRWWAEGWVRALLPPFPEATNINLSCITALMPQRRCWRYRIVMEREFGKNEALHLRSSWMGRRCRMQREALSNKEMLAW